ncbi:ABC transporter, ATP-binding protein [Actinokineospora spheciospongiae]|uniref:ABC transporter, ATP-binding protein n=1 Tax=Actinokineospora spheciospongiae TaxID=909613 RepID=W7IGD8_9PSEU|nr:ABC transporter ATP-binding protein [Actinokineospora spheciospongiae]EWC59955.1 ABC transporter, ATP-binding protein [Actinokineospora spheciospongiae]PWW59492.1 ABC-type multidrug transport system ATPase subunit [Actinokineospora spheciospongiae]
MGWLNGADEASGGVIATSTVVDRVPGQRTRRGTVLAVSGLGYTTDDGRGVVRDIGFEVAAGEAYGLAGPTGSGKSTIVRLVTGLLGADTGSITVGGESIDAYDGFQLRHVVSYVPQSAVMVPTATMAETLAFWARFHRIPRAERADRIAEALRRAGLAAHAAVPVDRCTGGELRELCLAMSLLIRPRMLVLDQPTAHIDPDSRVRLLTTLSDLRDQGMSVLYAGSDLLEVRWLCDRVGLLDEGTLLPDGADTLTGSLA